MFFTHPYLGTALGGVDSKAKLTGSVLSNVMCPMPRFASARFPLNTGELGCVLTGMMGTHPRSQT